VAPIQCLVERREVRTEREPWELPALLAILVIGAMVRFWGLGSVGLHGDEETMAMPTMHIVEHGTPFMPSGMSVSCGCGVLGACGCAVSQRENPCGRKG
jgi:hypothetical protein